MESNQIQTLITLLTEESPWASSYLRQKLLDDFKQDLEIIGKKRGQVNTNQLSLDEKIWEQLLSYWKSKESSPKNKARGYEKLAKFLEHLARKLDNNNLKKEYLQISAYFWEVAKGETPKALFQNAFSTKERTKNFLELDIHRQITLDERIIDALKYIILSIVNSIIWLKKQIISKLSFIVSAIIAIQIFASLVIAGILNLYLLFKFSPNWYILGLIIFLLLLIGEFIIIRYVTSKKTKKPELRLKLTFSLLLLFLFGSLLLPPNRLIFDRNTTSLEREPKLPEAFLNFNQQEAINNLFITKQAVDTIKIDNSIKNLVNDEIDIVKQIKSILFFTDNNFTDVINQKVGTEEGQKQLVKLILSYQLRVETNSSSEYPDIKLNGIIQGDTEQALMDDTKKALTEKSKNKPNVNKQKPTQAIPEELTFSEEQKNQAINKLSTSTQPAIEKMIQQIIQEGLVPNNTSVEEKVLKAIKAVLKLSEDFELMKVLSKTIGTETLQKQLVHKIYEYQNQAKAKPEYQKIKIVPDGIITDGYGTQKALLEDVKKNLNLTNN